MNDKIPDAPFIQLFQELVAIPAWPAKGKEQRVVGKDQAAAVEQQVLYAVVAALLQELALQDPADMND